MEKTTRIKIDIKTVGESCNMGIIPEYVERIVSVDDENVYSDRMSVRMYFRLDESDPIRNLETFLSGLKQRQSGENSRADSCKFIGGIKKIWRKLFSKKVYFMAKLLNIGF